MNKRFGLVPLEAVGMLRIPARIEVHYAGAVR